MDKLENLDCMDNMEADIMDKLENLDCLERMKKSGFEHCYMMLSRMKADIDYYLGYGGRNPKHLWAGSKREQIEIMRGLHSWLSENAEAPEWLTAKDLDDYAEQLGL